MFKEILKGEEARKKVKAGVDKACAAVAPTLGPIGMTALIEFPGLDPMIADDGVSILKNLEFEDHYENMGLQMLRKAALRTSAEGGDGTATTTVLTQAFGDAAFAELAGDSSRIREIRERLRAGLAETITYLKTIKRDVAPEDIEKIAAISSLDPEVAKLISETIQDVGVNGVVTVEKGVDIGYSHEVVKGARFDKGLISPFFINDHERKQTVLEDVYIILVDRKVSTNEQILSLLNSIGTGKDILIIADDVDSVALGTLAQNAVQKIANIACVRNPFTASAAREFLFDMAALTGATVISEERGMKLDEQTVAVCGRADRVVVNRDTTTIIGGRGEDVSARVESIQNELNGTTSEYTKMQLEDRLAQLTGGVGVIRVGAYTDTEYYAKKLKFENAINATQAALQEGILQGGGKALGLASVMATDAIFKKALRAPAEQMCVNAGLIEPQKQGWFKKREILPSGNAMKTIVWDSNYGVDFKSKTRVDMFAKGIIDPFKVTRLALESAVSIAISLIEMETAIVVAEDVTKNNK